MYINIYILGFEMALKKIKTEKTKNRKLTWYFNCSAYVELLLHTWFVVGDGRSGGHTASQISTTCVYGSNLKPNRWQLWYIDTPIDKRHHVTNAQYSYKVKVGQLDDVSSQLH